MSTTAVLEHAKTPGIVKVLADLTKVPISGMSTVTAAAGYVACARGVRFGALTAVLGTLLLAMGASALNEYQERDLDARMVRTRHRPLPEGYLSPPGALAIALGLGAAGLLILLIAHGVRAALLGALAMVWYNGVYTPLKRVTPFAVLPGSLIGALPPAIGWVAAGGRLEAPALLAICAVFFIWQVPHFWLLLLMHSDDYERGGFPTLTRRLGVPGLTRLTITWMCAAAVCVFLVPVLGATASFPSFILLSASAAWLSCVSLGLLRAKAGRQRLRQAFMHINLFALLVMAALFLDPLLG